jgi:hypothetical protein
MLLPGGGEGIYLRDSPCRWLAERTLRNRAGPVGNREGDYSRLTLATVIILPYLNAFPS